MQSIKEKNMNSARNGVSLQSNRVPVTPTTVVRDIDLVIDLRCDESDDDSVNVINENGNCLPNVYNLEQDIEKLIEVSKAFQTEYENEKDKNIGFIVADNRNSNFNIQILQSASSSLRRQKPSVSEVVVPANDDDNFYFGNGSSTKENIFALCPSQRNRKFAPKIPLPGPFGTGVTRPTPKKHSCIPSSELASVKHSYRVGWNVRPYIARYYNFDRTHPNLKLMENGDSMIPRRIRKEKTTVMTGKTTSDISTKPLLNKGLTWHEFFERSNVYAGQSLQSSYYGDGLTTHTTPTQTAISEVRTPKLNEIEKIQRYTLPPMNIRAECCIQRIPEVSIAPCEIKQPITTNTRLVEIIHEESASELQQTVGSLTKLESKICEPPSSPPHFPNDSECIPSMDLESLEVNDTTTVSEARISATSTTSKTLSENGEYDSSLEESVSVNVSRVSAFTDHVASEGKPIKHVSVQTDKLKTIAKRRKEAEQQRRTVTSSSDYSGFDYAAKYVPSSQQPPTTTSHEVILPTFPANELIQMVDEIFDTSSDAVNVSHKYVVKETSVQTDIVWKNINDLFEQQRSAVREPISNAEQSRIVESDRNQIAGQIRTGGTLLTHQMIESDGQQFIRPAVPPERNENLCRHTQLKKFEICSCLACKCNIRFSAVEINESQPCIPSSASSSSSIIQEPNRMPAAKINLFPSERFKQMKRVQKAHFESDPRISKTLKKIYATAKTIRTHRKATSSSPSSSDRYCPTDDSSSFSSCDDELLQPDLYTLRDEVLLFGIRSTDGIQYSSHLMETESSRDTSATIDECGVMDETSRDMLLGHNLFCTNSEESTSNSVFNRRGSDLERCLLNDIENSGSDPSAVLSSMFSTSSLERKINEISIR